MPCRHINSLGWREYECGITGASVDEDCGEMGGPCAPRIALDVKAGKASLDELPRPMRRGVQAVLIQLGEIEPEEQPEQESVGVEARRLTRPRRKAGRVRKNHWRWSDDGRARLSAAKKKWWADKKAAEAKVKV